MRIFHIATVADWEAAQATGRYTTSTRGRTLAEEGFIHASRGDQWQDVRRRWYADATEPLVLLSIDTDLLDVPVVDEQAPGSTETFPHVYGALDVRAVTHAMPLGARTGGSPEPSPTFSQVFVAEVVHRLVLATVVLVCATAGLLAGAATDVRWGPLVGAAAGAVLGAALALLVHRRRERRWA